MEDSLPLEIAPLTVSLPLDLTNGKYEEVLHTELGGVGGNNPTQPGTSSDLYKPLCEVYPRRVGDPDPDIGVPPATSQEIHTVSSSEDDMDVVSLSGSPQELLSTGNNDAPVVDIASYSDSNDSVVEFQPHQHRDSGQVRRGLRHPR